MALPRRTHRSRGCSRAREMRRSTVRVGQSSCSATRSSLSPPGSKVRSGGDIPRHAAPPRHGGWTRVVGSEFLGSGDLGEVPDRPLPASIPIGLNFRSDGDSSCDASDPRPNVVDRPGSRPGTSPGMPRHRRWRGHDEPQAVWRRRRSIMDERGHLGRRPQEWRNAHEWIGRFRTDELEYERTTRLASADVGTIPM